MSNNKKNWQTGEYIRLAVLTIYLTFSIISCSANTKDNSANTIKSDKTVKEESKMELLKQVTSSLPEDIQAGILSNSSNFLSQISDVLKQPADQFILADKQHFLGEDYKPEDIVLLKNYPELILSRNNLSLRKILIPDLIRMVKDARKQNLTLQVSSTYRSYSYQKKLFDREVELYGLETAERESARPGTSQHQLGTAIDFGTITDDYAFSPEGKWLFKNAWKYGFSLSYPDGYENLTGYRYECWHYRYIGPEAAKLQRDYFNNIQYYLLLFLNDNWNELKRMLQE